MPANSRWDLIQRLMVNESSLRTRKKERCKAGKNILFQQFLSSLEIKKARAPWNDSEVIEVNTKRYDLCLK
jgi:hypothetical protein